MPTCWWVEFGVVERCVRWDVEQQAHERACILLCAHTHRHEERRDAEGLAVRVHQLPPPLHVGRVEAAGRPQGLKLRHEVDHLVLLVQVRQLPAVRLGAHLLVWCFWWDEC